MVKLRKQESQFKTVEIENRGFTVFKFVAQSSRRNFRRRSDNKKVFKSENNLLIWECL